MSDKMALADNSMSDNATTVERECLTDYRDPDECPTKQQVGKSANEGRRRNESGRVLGAYSVCGRADSEPSPAMFLPYPMVDFGFDELIIEVSAASPLTQNQKQHDIETVSAANYLLGRKPIATI